MGISSPPRPSRFLRLLRWLLASPPKFRFAAPGGKRKIAFIKRGPFSHTNTRVAELLTENFPGLTVELVDMDEELFLRSKWVVVWNVLIVLRLYGWDIFCRRRSIRECFYRTPYIFRFIKRLMETRLGPRLNEFAFSVQTQSLYDASIAGLPHFVYTDHTHLANLYYPAFDTGLLFSREWIDFEREVYREATRVFIMSRHVGRSIIEHYGLDPKRISCVYAGSNIGLTAAPLDNDGYSNQRILFIGIEWERKGGPILIEAFKRVRETLPDATLVIIGATPEIHLPGVEVIGRVPMDEVEKHLLKASVFCMPTKVEPFGIAPIEALVHKIPVVASRIGALPDIIRHGETGLLVAADSVDELAAALVTLLSNPAKCREFGELGHRLVKETYTWQAVGQRMKDEISADIRAANGAYRKFPGV